MVQGVIREAREEVGVLIEPADLAFSHVIHHRNPLGQGRIGFFFTTTRWQGEPDARQLRKTPTRNSRSQPGASAA